MSGQWFTPAGEYTLYSHNISVDYAITDAMCAEHDWLTAGTTSYKFAFNKISKNLLKFI